LHANEQTRRQVSPNRSPSLGVLLIHLLEYGHLGTYQESCPLGVLELRTSKQLTSICALGSS
jgi:hypothetical protein